MTKRGPDADAPGTHSLCEQDGTLAAGMAKRGPDADAPGTH